jgi:hypothetical protein
MQILVTGFLVSLTLWTILVAVAMKATVRLYRDQVLGERWLLVVPFLLASLVFFGLRYRFLLWVMSRQEIHEFFSIGSFYEVDKFVVILCLPCYYAVSVLRPEWVVRKWINLPLLVLLPFGVRLVLYLVGLTAWEVNPGQFSR